MLTDIMLNYPIISEIFLWMGIFRIIFKPLMYYLGEYVKVTTSVEDDKKYSKIINSPIYIILCFLLDLTASIKLPQKETK